MPSCGYSPRSGGQSANTAVGELRRERRRAGAGAIRRSRTGAAQVSASELERGTGDRDQGFNRCRTRGGVGPRCKTTASATEYRQTASKSPPAEFCAFGWIRPAQTEPLDSLRWRDSGRISQIGGYQGITVIISSAAGVSGDVVTLLFAASWGRWLVVAAVVICVQSPVHDAADAALEGTQRGGG